VNRTTAATNKRVNMTAHTSAGSAAGYSSWLVIGATPITGEIYFDSAFSWVHLHGVIVSSG
jgi:hypothetical protein